jgi:SMI1 / KNR4 family (SUKH-1)
VTDDDLILEARRRLPADAPPPATLDELAEAETLLGFRLPRLLGRMYTEVANGGWGPEYGANGLIGGARADLESGLVDWYRTMRAAGPDDEDPAWPGWPEGLVAVCHWGCAIWSCVDCNSADGRVVRFDPNPFGPESWSGAWTVERPTLADFLRDWLTGDLPFMPAEPYPTCPTPPTFTSVWRV